MRSHKDLSRGLSKRELGRMEGGVEGSREDALKEWEESRGVGAGGITKSSLTSSCQVPPLRVSGLGASGPRAHELPGCHLSPGPQAPHTVPVFVP